RPSQSIKGVLAAIALRCLNPQPLCFQVSIPARPVLTIENRHYLAIASGMPALRKLVKSCFIAFFPQLLSRGVIRVETCALRREVHRASGDHHHAERTSLPAGGNPRPALHRAVSLNRPQDRAPTTVFNLLSNLRIICPRASSVAPGFRIASREGRMASSNHSNLKSVRSTSCREPT